MFNNLQNNPKQIFLIDAIGAFLSALFLIAILGTFQAFFGMPMKIIYILSLLAVCFSIYSISCYFFIPNNWKPFLKDIIIANSCYCLLTIGMVVYFYQDLTALGVVYFLLELLVIIILVSFEIKMFKQNE